MIENEEESKTKKKIENIYCWLLITTDAVAANTPTYVHPHQQNRLPGQRDNLLRYMYLRQISLLKSLVYQTAMTGGLGHVSVTGSVPHNYSWTGG